MHLLETIKSNREDKKSFNYQPKDSISILWLDNLTVLNLIWSKLHSINTLKWALLNCDFIKGRDLYSYSLLEHTKPKAFGESWGRWAYCLYRMKLFELMHWNCKFLMCKEHEDIHPTNSFSIESISLGIQMCIDTKSSASLDEFAQHIIWLNAINTLNNVVNDDVLL